MQHSTRLEEAIVSLILKEQIWSNQLSLWLPGEKYSFFASFCVMKESGDLVCLVLVPEIGFLIYFSTQPPL